MRDGQIRPERLALDQTDWHLEYINRQATAGGLFVLILHITTGIAPGVSRHRLTEFKRKTLESSLYGVPLLNKAQ